MSTGKAAPTAQYLCSRANVWRVPRGRVANPATGPDLAGDLLDVIGPLRRVLRRRLRRDVPEGGLPQAQVELLGLIGRQPGVRVQEAAAALQLAANSVSTLVNHLVDGGLVQRERDPADGRSVCLTSTEKGDNVRAVRREFRREQLHQAMTRLSPADLKRIETAVPSLRRLVTCLEGQP